MKITSHYSDNYDFLFFLLGTLLFTSLVAGFYPAFYISAFNPVNILKGKVRFGGTNYFTRSLLLLQYAFTLLAIIFSLAFYENATFQKELDLGFNHEGTIVTYIRNQGEYETYRNALLPSKDIISIAGSKHSIFSYRYNDPVKSESKQIEVDIMDVGDDYLKTMGLTLLQGRDFIKNSETDRKESVLITQNLANQFGWNDALGKEIIWMDTVHLYVVGVLKNVYTQGLWSEMEPMMLRYTSPENYTHLIVQAPVEKLIEVNTFMEKEWKKIFSNRMYTGNYMNQGMVEANEVNNNIVIMFAFIGTIVLVYSITGLYTLVSLNIIKKMKEIGVRKVLGASLSNITRILNTEFLITLLLASVLGSLLAFYSVDGLMDGIWDYYQTATPLSYFLSVFVLLFSSSLAVAYKVIRAAGLNPVDTLKDE